MSKDDLDPVEFLQRHLRVTNFINERKVSYTYDELIKLCQLVTSLFKKESTLAEFSPPCVVVGDIHGQYMDLIRILNCRREDVKDVKNLTSVPLVSQNYMFLGDYVDRGAHSLECICLLFALKLLFTKQYILLRGNHETRMVNQEYGFLEELIRRFDTKEGTELWEEFNTAFSFMPLAGLIGGCILCMHGGISMDLKSLDDIRSIKRPLKDITGKSDRIPLDLLWADPASFELSCGSENIGNYRRNQTRGLSCEFNEIAVKQLCEKLDLKLIVRGHQVQEDGFEFFADGRLLTIFSAPNYMNEKRNNGAVLRIAANGGISMTILRCPKKEKGATLEQDEEEEPTVPMSKEELNMEAIRRKSGVPKFNKKKSTSFCRRSSKTDSKKKSKYSTRYIRARNKEEKEKID